MRSKTGIIVSKKMAKTLVVKVDTQRTHSKYKKKYVVSKKFYAHTEDTSKFNEWDVVTIKEVAPISKLKHWVVDDQQSSL